MASADRFPLNFPEDAIIYQDDGSAHSNIVASTQAGDQAAEEVSIVELVRGMSWRKRVTIITAAFVNFTGMSCFAIMAPFLPLEADRKGIDSVTVGMIFACFQLVQFFGSILFGRFLVQIGARFVYLSGILIAATCTVLFGFLEWCPPGNVFVITAISCRIVEAIGVTMCETASTAIVANEFPERVATVIGLLESISGIGFMIGPTIGGALYDLGGFYLPFVTVGGIFFAAGVAASFTLPLVSLPPPKDRSLLFRKFVLLPAVIMSAITVFICATMMSFLDPILSDQLVIVDPALKDSQTLIGLIFLVMPALYAILSPLVGYLADTFKHQLPILAMGNIGFMIGYLFIGPCPFLPIPKQELWLLIVSLVLLGFFMSFCFMPAFALINADCIKAGLPNDLDLFALVSGFFGFSFNLGAFVGPLLAGFLVKYLGFEWATALMSLAPVINFIAIFIYAVYSKTHSPVDTGPLTST